MKALKALARTSRFSTAKPWTWKHVGDLKTADGLSAFAAKKVVKATGKAALGAVGLTGDPVGQTAQEGATGAAGNAADEADEADEADDWLSGKTASTEVRIR
ncbi:hypothetical protein [Streptomyces fractus]|uniref:hypothetical protein n=1 Tax=Streptomyces fractus TaxID=641806 RepID=UPI003CEAFBB9